MDLSFSGAGFMGKYWRWMSSLGGVGKLQEVPVSAKKNSMEKSAALGPFVAQSVAVERMQHCASSATVWRI